MEETFALIVTNNRSLAHHRPDLQFADDDGARYYRVFRMVAEKDHVALLTTFDPSSERLYPDLVPLSRRPRLDEVDKAVADLSHRILAAKKQGHRTIFYFVFAGHGDVDSGKGHLELSDGKLGPDELENKVISAIKADVIHLVLDSCNSFFVVNPRKPGGRRWATPKDMSQGFSKRHPNVGVFLSTSSEAEVYEWSEIQSGIFSHEVRSGLSGAADINADGRITYSELESFVAVANRQIRNENYRPKVFARGPWNKGSLTLFANGEGKGRRLVVDDEERRLWIRDEQGTRLVDLHKERGFRLQLTIPVADDKELYVQERVVDKDGTGRPTIRQVVVSPTAEKVLLASLEPRSLPVTGRGADRVFERLFSEAYGPRAYRRYAAELTQRHDVVFGISPKEAERMDHYLSSLSRTDRIDRKIGGGVLMFGGAFAVGIGTAWMTGQEDDESALWPSVVIGLGAASVLGGLYEWYVHRWDGEKAHTAFRRALKKPGASAEYVVAETEKHLLSLARRERQERRLGTTLMLIEGGLILAGTATLGVLEWQNKVDLGRSPVFYTAMGGIGLMSLGTAAIWSYRDSTVEKTLRLYREDPDLKVRFGLAPVKDGAALGVSGTF